MTVLGGLAGDSAGGTGDAAMLVAPVGPVEPAESPRQTIQQLTVLLPSSIEYSRFKKTSVFKYNENLTVEINYLLYYTEHKFIGHQLPKHCEK